MPKRAVTTTADAVDPAAFLRTFNRTYHKLHHAYERHYWSSHMGDHSVDEAMMTALRELDAFRTDPAQRTKIAAVRAQANQSQADRLDRWDHFFAHYQIPPEARSEKAEIDALEAKIAQIRTSQREGYTDPRTGRFTPASTLKMRALMRTDDTESVREACYRALEAQAEWHLPEYVELIKRRNAFARAIGYEDFYAYKLEHLEGMTKAQLFDRFDAVRSALGGVFAEVRELAKTMPGLRKPWNFSYLLAGDFTKEEDPYFQFADALDRWGRSFAALGIDFAGGSLTLDLLDRSGKHNNGFCHWPELVRYEGATRHPGAANFTCNVVPAQVGAGKPGYVTLFHEGGHAAHLLNSQQVDVCDNHEYAPMTAAWAETHSMFLDALLTTPEWLMRYAVAPDGSSYPWALYERKVRELAILRPWRIISIIFVAEFERRIYELERPTPRKLQQIARATHREFFDRTEGSLLALTIPHLYAWESACNYHGYGLAEMAVAQWQEYFYSKYGYIVDNPAVGAEMRRTWAWGARKPFLEATQAAFGKSLSSSALIRQLRATPETQLRRAKQRLARMESVPRHTGPVELKARISLVDGRETIARNQRGFAAMTRRYRNWLEQQAGDR